MTYQIKISKCALDDGIIGMYVVCDVMSSRLYEINLI